MTNRQGKTYKIEIWQRGSIFVAVWEPTTEQKRRRTRAYEQTKERPQAIKTDDLALSQKLPAGQRGEMIVRPEMINLHCGRCQLSLSSKKLNLTHCAPYVLIVQTRVFNRFLLLIHKKNTISNSRGRQGLSWRGCTVVSCLTWAQGYCGNQRGGKQGVRSPSSISQYHPSQRIVALPAFAPHSPSAANLTGIP